MEPISHHRVAEKRLVMMTCWIEERDQSSLTIGDDETLVALVCLILAAVCVCVCVCVVCVTMKTGTQYTTAFGITSSSCMAPN